MEMLFLGTAAAEAIPGVFCACDACKYAWKTGEKEIRTRSGGLIDGKIKLDFGPDSYLHALKYRLDYAALRAVLITHTHDDHFDGSEISYRRSTFAHLPDDQPPMTVYGNGKLGEMMAPKVNKWLAYQQVKPFETYQIEGYAVTPLEAVHCLKGGDTTSWPVVHEGTTYGRLEEALFYLIEKDGASILYAHDTDEFTPADMEYLAGKKLDLISLDCTNGKRECDYVGHMGITDNLRMREKLLANGAADDHTIFVANHFSHNGILPYEEMVKRLPGFLVSYDGMRVDTEKGLL